MSKLSFLAPDEPDYLVNDDPPEALHRGIEIRRFEDVNGFRPYSPDHALVFTARYRREDDAPIQDTAPTIEAACAEIDWILDN